MNTQPQRVSIDLPYYIDPRALEVGRTVVGILDGERSPLVVIRVEPALICAKPDGSLVDVLANMVEVQDEP